MRKEEKRLVIENQQIYWHYKERLINLALSQFEWHGLPETCDRLYFEKRLLFGGKAAMYKPAGTDFWLSTDFIQKGGGLSVYGYPRMIRGVGYGPHNLIDVDPKAWEILFDNMTMTSLMPHIELFAVQLWEIHQVFRSNLQQQITPYIVLGSRDQQLSLKNLFNLFKGFAPVIEVKTNFDPNAVTTIDTGVDFKGQEILEALKTVWAEALATMGITAETTKKERLLNNEMTLNRQEDIISLNSRLMNRMDFCNKMNKKYGMNLSVNLSSDEYLFQPYQGDFAQQALDMADSSPIFTREPEKKDDKEE